MKQETAAIHAGNIVTDSNKPAVQPITTSTTFLHQEDSLVYSRANNPNRMALENLLAKLEFGEDAAAFSSGNAAGMAVFQSLEPGSHIVAPDDMYHGLRAQLVQMFQGIHSVSFVDMTNPDNIAAVIKPETKLIWVETPSNPLLKISDIKKICSIASERKIKVACDNTFATPVFQNPLLLGADIVMHSSTKYLGGHSDILGGALVTKKMDEFWEKVKFVQKTGGAVPSPFDTYLLCRSIKTLSYRMKGHVEHAGILAEYLFHHPQVEAVYYPGLKSHPGHEVAASQMSGFGGMLSFLVKGEADDADRVISKLKYYTNATSLGGVESLIERRAASEGPDSKTPPNLVRLSVGLEHVDDLVEDMDQALGK
ncbi:trans-sulfuration enzyme family protein [Mongoliibacter ruber]|uniref:Cystathionine gamma-synthase n=1 Tax=Mongoliibacter ruber TaxID=1750599 RepID=A0A2T0WQE1_9BACT|nr:aminotransferase class I/II-fold pyridoxal phosphate-dependent enzyme [Mongoliibacter ruber]PRY88921.1 cystathionine gamma-synthase [Mongoliibacter ruber]